MPPPRPTPVRIVFPFLIAVAAAGAQALPRPDFTIASWATANGLPRSRVNAFARDPERSLRLGTSAGLARVDGRRVAHASTGRSLTDAGYLRPIVSHRGSSSHPRHAAGTPTPVVLRHADRREGPVGGGPVVDLSTFALDRDGCAWLATSRGLRRLGAGRWRTVSGDARGTTGWIRRSGADPRGGVRLATPAVLLRVDRARVVRAATGCAEVRDLAVAGDGSLLALTRSGIGIERIVQGASDGTPVWRGTVTPEAATALAGDTVVGAAVGGGARRLVRTAPGTPPLVGRGIGHDMGHVIAPFLADRAGRLWFGFDGGPVSWAPHGADRARRLDPAPLEPAGREHAMCEEPDGALLVGQLGTLVRGRDGHRGAPGAAEEMPPGEVQVRPPVRDRNGITWVASNGGGLARRHGTRDVPRVAAAGTRFAGDLPRLAVDPADPLPLRGDGGATIVARREAPAGTEVRRPVRSLARITPEDGIPVGNNGFPNVLRDSVHGARWFATVDGVSMVRTRDVGDVAPPARARLHLVVGPQWWQSAWLRGGALVAALAAGWWGVAWSTARVRARAARLERALAERDHAERVALEAQRHLAHAARVATAGELAGSLAHELTQPLSAIMATAAHARRLARRGAAAELDEALALIVEQGERAAGVIHGLRAFLNRRQPPDRPVEVDRVVRDTLRLLQRELRDRDVDVRVVDVRTRRGEVLGNDVQLQQVLVNLLLNAAEAMEEVPTGVRRVEVRLADAEGATLRLTVRDSGPGIVAGMRDVLFDPFVSTKSAGLGLGLSLSRTIAESHGGRLWAESPPGGGGVLHLELPVVSP